MKKKKKEYESPELELTLFRFDENICGDFYSDPGNSRSTGDDPENDPFA